MGGADFHAFGNVLPDVLATRGFSFERIVRFQVYTGAGQAGAPMGIAAGAAFSLCYSARFYRSPGRARCFDLSLLRLASLVVQPRPR